MAFPGYNGKGWWTYRNEHHWYELFYGNKRLVKCYFYLGGMPHKVTWTRPSDSSFVQKTWTTTKHAKTLIPSGWQFVGPIQNVWYLKYTAIARAGVYDNQCFYIPTLFPGGQQVGSGKGKVNISSDLYDMGHTKGELEVIGTKFNVKAGDVFTFSFLDEASGSYFRCGSDINTAGINYYKMEQPKSSANYLFFDKNKAKIENGPYMPDNAKPNQDRGCGNDGSVIIKYTYSK